MDSFELNKVLGAILGTCLVLLVTSFTAGAIFAPVMPEKPGYEIVAKETPEGGAKEGAAAPAQPSEKQIQTAPPADGGGAGAEKKIRTLPPLREKRSQPRRPESLRRHRRQEGRGARVQFLGGDEGQGRRVELRRTQQVHRKSQGLCSGHRDGLCRHPEGQRARRRDR